MDNVFVQRQDVFTASCVLFCSEVFGFSGFFLFCFIFPSAMWSNSSPFKKNSSGLLIF